MPAWLQISLRKWLSSGAKVTFWRPFCLCKLDGQELKILLGNRVFRIQHTQIRLKSLVPNFYSKMLLTFTLFRNLTSLIRMDESWTNPQDQQTARGMNESWTNRRDPQMVHLPTVMHNS